MKINYENLNTPKINSKQYVKDIINNNDELKKLFKEKNSKI